MKNLEEVKRQRAAEHRSKDGVTPAQNLDTRTTQITHNAAPELNPDAQLDNRVIHQLNRQGRKGRGIRR